MATEVDTVITRFETEASSAVADLKQLQVAQDRARESVERLPKAGAAADNAVKTLGERMKSFAQAERSEGRTAAYFVSQLEGIAPKGSMAASVLGELTQALVGGVGLGLALGAVSLALRAYTQHLEEEAKAEKEAAEAAKKAAEERAKLNRDAVKFGNDRVANLKAMRDSFSELTMAEKAHNEVQAVNAQLQITSDPAFKGTLRMRLAEAKALEELIGKLESAKKAREEELATEQRGFEIQVTALKARDEAIKQAAKSAEAASRAQLAQLQKQAEAATQGLIGDFGAPPTINLPKYTEAEVAQAKYELMVIASNERIRKSFEDMGDSAVRGFAGDVSNAFGTVIRGSAAYDRAMRASGQASKNSADLSAAAFAAFTQNALASIAERSAVEAIFEVAQALAAFARYDYKAGGEHLASAGTYALAAAAAGGAAYVIGQTRGMTGSERDSLAAAQANGASASSGGGTGASSGSASAGPAGSVHTREVVIVIGDPFETPQETARRAARRIGLAADLNMLPRA